MTASLLQPRWRRLSAGRSRAVASKKLCPEELMPQSRACPTTGSDRGFARSNLIR